MGEKLTASMLTRLQKRLLEESKQVSLPKKLGQTDDDYRQELGRINRKVSKKKIIETRRYKYHGIFRGDVLFFWAPAMVWVPMRDFAKRYNDGLWVKIVAFFVGGKVVDRDATH